MPGRAKVREDMCFRQRDISEPAINNWYLRYQTVFVWLRQHTLWYRQFIRQQTVLRYVNNKATKFHLITKL